MPPANVVVVVEKDFQTRAAVAHMVEALGNAAILCEDSQAALDVLDAAIINVIIINSGKQDSDSAALAFEAKVRQPGIKILALSTLIASETIDRYVDAYVQKPFTLQQLEHAIYRVTEE